MGDQCLPQQALIIGRVIQLFRTIGGDEHDVLEMGAADVRPVVQHDARFETHHHVLHHLESDVAVHEQGQPRREAHLVEYRVVRLRDVVLVLL